MEANVSSVMSRTKQEGKKSLPGVNHWYTHMLTTNNMTSVIVMDVSSVTSAAASRIFQFKIMITPPKAHFAFLDLRGSQEMKRRTCWLLRREERRSSKSYSGKKIHMRRSCTMVFNYGKRYYYISRCIWSRILKFSQHCKSSSWLPGSII
jgi:hypothetical protein